MRSEIVIAHISDLHFPTYNKDVWDKLKAYLSEEKPDLILVTGDLTNHPRPKRHREAKAKLLELASACAPEGAGSAGLYVVPGNHDHAFWGNWNFGTSPIWRYNFNRVFKDQKKDFFEFSTARCKAYFFCFNSNPYIARWAKGAVSGYQLKRLKKKVDELRSTDPDFEDAYKVALVHHHPVPIPHVEQFEKFMVLKNAGEFLRYLAQCKIDLVLHGHKHESVISSVSLGTPAQTSRSISVVASGSTTRQGEARSSFNLVTIYEDHHAKVTQVFAEPGGEFKKREPVRLPLWESFIDDKYRKLIEREGYQIARYSRTVTIDSEGDAIIQTRIDNLRIEDDHIFSRVKDFEEITDVGTIENFRYDAPPDVERHLVKAVDPAHKWAQVKLDIRRENQVRDFSFTMSYSNLNAWALNEEEFERKYTEARERPPYEEVWYECNKPVGIFNLEITFPDNCAPVGQPRLLIYAPVQGGYSANEEISLGEHLATALNYSSSRKVILLSLKKPLLGYRYSVRWYLPAAPPVKENIKYRTEKENLIYELVKLEGSEILKMLMTMVEKQVREKMVAALKQAREKDKIEHEKIDVTLSVPVRTEAMVSQLCFISTNLDSLDIGNMRLDIGDGTAGRAFKENRARSYDKQDVKRDDPKKNAYIKMGSYEHQVLYCVPIRHPLDTDQVIGILSVGSQRADSAMRAETDVQAEERLRIIGDIANTYLLGRLDEICHGVLSLTKEEK